jgi:hypothetical protein
MVRANPRLIRIARYFFGLTVHKEPLTVHPVEALFSIFLLDKTCAKNDDQKNVKHQYKANACEANSR